MPSMIDGPRDSGDPRGAVVVVRADFERDDHRAAVLALTDAYARDPMGQGAALAPDVRERLVPALAAHPTTVILLAFHGAVPVGIATCFVGFSSFAARPLLNIHDVAVLAGHRGVGIGAALLAGVEAEARTLGCVKLTLEVGDTNHPARALYEKMGFAHADGGPGAGFGLFFTKPLG